MLYPNNQTSERLTRFACYWIEFGTKVFNNNKNNKIFFQRKKSMHWDHRNGSVTVKRQCSCFIDISTWWVSHFTAKLLYIFPTATKERKDWNFTGQQWLTSDVTIDYSRYERKSRRSLPREFGHLESLIWNSWMLKPLEGWNKKLTNSQDVCSFGDWKFSRRETEEKLRHHSATLIVKQRLH